MSSDLHPLLAARWSPRAFDPTAEVSTQELASLLEAARWAPSRGNTQPWRFAVGRRDDEPYKRIFANLTEDDQRWAGRAAALLVGAYLLRPPAGHAAYDLGQAVAHLTFQAGALGLHVRQLPSFDGPSLHADLELPEDVVAKVVIAVGRLGDPNTLPPDLRAREVNLRERRPLADLVLHDPVKFS
jgi:nitroreductase